MQTATQSQLGVCRINQQQENAYCCARKEIGKESMGNHMLGVLYLRFWPRYILYPFYLMYLVYGRLHLSHF